MFSVYRNNNNSTSVVEKLGAIACLKCRKDKKKCDRKVPICSRCSERNFECRPYERKYYDTKLLSMVIKSISIDDRNKYARGKGKLLNYFIYYF
jgi:hypothetical protein